MRRWTRAGSARLCGGCAKSILEDAPMLEIVLPNIKHPMVRGVCCAGEAPPDLPFKVFTNKSTKRMTRLTASRPEWLPHKESE